MTCSILTGPDTRHCPNHWLQHREVQDIQVLILFNKTAEHDLKSMSVNNELHSDTDGIIKAMLCTKVKCLLCCILHSSFKSFFHSL